MKEVLPKILRALRGAMHNGPVDRIEVHHVHADGSAGRVARLSGEQISGKGVTFEQIADQLLENVQGDAELFRGVQTYAILYFKTGEHDAFIRTNVQIQSSKGNFRDELEESEPANEKGVTSMTMRHLESRNQDLTNRERLIAQQQEAMLTRLGSLLERAVEAFPRILQAEQSLLDRQQERNLELKRAEKHDKIVEQGVEKLMMFAGPLAAKILPKVAGQPGGEVATDMMLVNLLSSLDETQVMQIYQSLKPEQQANFVELYRGLRARHEKVKLDQNGTAEKKEETTS